MQACHWPPELSDFRLACEECHKRKVRCEPPREGSQGSCQACRTNRRTCLFSLKSKTGRRPKSNKTTANARSGHKVQTPLTASRRQLPTHESLSPTLTTTTVSHNGGDLYYVENLSTAQGRAAAQELTQPVMGYANNFFFPDDSASASGPGDDQYVQELELPPNHESGRRLDELGFESPIPATRGQEPFSYRDTPEPSLELWQQEPLSMDHWMPTPDEMTGEVSGKRSLPDSVGLDRPKRPAPIQVRNNLDRSRGEPLDFLDTIRFFCETSNHYQGNLLDIKASSDKHKLLIILSNIEDLGRKAAAAVVREPDVASPLGGGSRQDQYIRMLTRVAVMGAVDIADDLLKYNLRIRNITLSGAQEVELQCGDNANAATASMTTEDALESVLSLVRLDFSLHQFSLFLSTEQCDMDRCQAASNVISGMEHGRGEGKGEAGTPALLRMAQMRRQLWTLVGELRKSW